MTVDPRFYDEILPRLWRGGKYGNYWSNDDGEGHKVTLWHNLSENPTPKVPTVWVKRMNCYFGIHPTKGRGDSWARSKIADIALINCLYAEVDGIDTPAAEQNWIDWLQNDCPVRPSLIVFSGGGLHVYWLLREPFVLDTPEALERAIVAQKAIVARIGGDTSVHDLARVLRIPGTINHKPERAGAIVAIRFWEPDNDYTLEEIEDAIPEFITSVQETRQEAHSATSSFESLGLDDQHVLRVMFGAKNGERNRSLWEGDASVVKNGDHSIADLTLCDALAYFTGCDRDQMDRLFRQSGLMRPKWDSRPDYRDSTLNKAINTTQSVYDPTKVRDAEDAAAELALAEQLIANHAQNQNGNNQQSEPTPTPKPPPANADIAPLQTRSPLLAFGHNDEGNAQAFLSIYKGNYRYCGALDSFLAYNGKFWIADGADSKLQRAITDVLQRRHNLAQAANLDTLKSASKPNASNVRNCQFMLKAILETNINLFDESPDMLNCSNGVVNLRTGNLEPHSADQLYTYCVPVDYDPHADYVHWIEFIGSIVSDPEIADYLQMALGYSATGHTSEECMFAVVGPTRSGKGTLTETMLKVMPKPIGVEVDFSTFTAKRDADTQNFDLAALKPARFVAASESKHNETLNEAKVKLATGGNYIRAAFKHKDFFEYKPQFKIWLTTNHQIKGDVNDDAFWGRLRLIEFPHSFLGREDKTLKRRMQSPESLSGILNWMVQGSIAWYAAPHGLTVPDAIKEKVASVRKDIDIIQQWIDDCCEVDDVNAWTANPKIWASFDEWCKALGLNRRGYTDIGTLTKALGAKGFDVSQRGYYSDGIEKKRSRGVRGLTV